MTTSKITIKKLISIIQKQQDALRKVKKGSFETIEIADEISYTINKLSKVLTTSQKINRELEVRKQYEKKLSILLTDYAILFMNNVRKLYDLSDVPNAKGYFVGKKNKEGESQLKKKLYKKLQDIDLVIKQYQAENLRTYPTIKVLLSAEYSFYYYLNDDKYEVKMGHFTFEDNPFFRICSIYYYKGKKGEFYFYKTPSSAIQIKTSGGKSTLISFSGPIKSDELKDFKKFSFVSYPTFDEIKIYLPEGISLKDVSTVDFRWPRFNPKNIKIEFE